MFAMEDRIRAYELLLQTPRPEVSPSKSPVGGEERPSVGACVSQAGHPPHLPVTPEQPGNPDKWITVRKRSSKPGPTGHSIPVHVSNRFSPLIDNPEVKPTLIIGSSIVRNVKTPATIVKCLPGARTGDIENHLKLLAKANKKFGTIIIHAGGNDTRRRQSEVTKVGVESLCSFAKTMSDSVVFSGPLPDLTSDDMFSRMSSFRRWLVRWCPDNNVGLIDNWSSFWGRSGLISKDGIHPTLDGAALLSKNMTSFITKQ